MTRASEFCYIAELAGPSPRYMLACTNDRVWWTPTGEKSDMEMAMRFTEIGARQMAERAALSPHHSIGFRKVLAG